MDLAVSRAIEDEKINKSNVAFGGNMYFSREIVQEVCHDPYAPRGEDYDYVMNAKLEGFDFYFNPHTKIVHLPPDSNGSQAGDNVHKLVADIYRFIYMQEKFNFFKEYYPQKIYDISYIQPYPGEYLLHDLYSHAEEALIKKYPSFCKHNNPKNIVYDAINTAKKKTIEYVNYLEKWKSCMKLLPSVSNNFIESFLV